jgi:hypothetical protein
MDDVTRLSAIEDLRILKARYWRYVDTKQWDSLRPLFAEDASFIAGGDSFNPSGRDEIVDLIREYMLKVTSVHRGYQHELEVIDESTAQGIWVMTDYLVYPPGGIKPGTRIATDQVHGYGHYVDEYAKADGDWQFKRVELYRLRLEVSSYSSTELPDVLRR